MEALDGPPVADKAHILNKERIFLEVATFLYFLSKNGAIPLVQQFVYTWVSRKHNFTEPNVGENGFCDTTHDILGAKRQLVNDESSLIILYLNIAELLPSAIMVLVMGWWSDHMGKRKFLMWVPCIGNVLYCVGFLLPASLNQNEYNQTAFAVMIVATTLSGFSGNVAGFLAGNACYISDTDSPERRTLRLAVVELSIGLTFAIANIGIGFWIPQNGYVPALGLLLAFSLISFFLIVAFIREPYEEEPLRTPSLEEIKMVKKFCGCGTLTQRRLWAVFFAFQVYVLVQQGQERTFVPFLESPPLCYGPIKIGLFFFTLFFVSGLGSWPGVPFLHRLGVNDVSIFALAVFSKMLGSFMLAFSKNDGAVYSACVLQVFHLLPFAVGRSVVSRQVGPTEQGTVYGMVHSVQALCTFLGPVLLNGVFVGSQNMMSGAVFAISGGMLILPAILLGLLKYWEKKDELYIPGGYANVDTQSETPSELHTPASESSALMQR